MTDRSFADRTAFVGVATSDFHALHQVAEPDWSITDLAVEVGVRAIADAGLRREDIDGYIYSGNHYTSDMLTYQPAAYRLGLNNARYMQTFSECARALPSMLGHAAMAIMHGMASTILITHAVNFRSGKFKFGAHPKGGDLYDSVYGLASPGAHYAMSLSRYRALYGGTDEQMGAIPLALRRHARLNPQAIMRDKPLDMAGYLDSPYLARPLRRNDYCLVNDGAVAFVLTSAERARDLPHRPVLLTGVAQQAALCEQYTAPDFWAGALASIKASLLDTVGVGVGDIDTLGFYDNFSPVLVWGLEGLGWCKPGEGFDWVQGGRIELGGELPVNTSGGMISEAYLQGANQHAELIRQLRGEAGERQVPDCERSLYFGLSTTPGASLLTRG